jgi:predicted aspartyl protease
MMETISFKVQEIERSSFHPIIQGQINGEEVLLILDTGASRTVIDKSITSGMPIIANEHNEPFAAGINAQKISVEQIELPAITLGDIEFNNLKVFSSDLRPISKLYEELSGIKIHGLLGCDFLVEYKVVVNFKTGMIQLNRNPNWVKSVQEP